MVATSQFYGGQITPISLSAPLDTAGVILASNTAGSAFGQRVLSGAISAATYKEILSVSSGGTLRLAGVYRVDSTSQTLGLKIVLDGVTVFDEVDALSTTVSKGFFGVGFYSAASTINGLMYEAIPFKSSLSISIKSSAAITDSLALVYATTNN